MRICIDSCVFIHGLQRTDPASAQLLTLVSPTIVLLTPRLIVQEVTRNLRTPEQVRGFYHLLQSSPFAFIVDEPVPRGLVEKYATLGLPAKADAFIGAFAEWMAVRYLISDNRHFLRDLQTSAFEVVEAQTFIARWENGEL
jgi:hypothetical protein